MSEDSHVPQDLLAHRVVKLFGSIGPQTLSQCRDALLHIDSESEAEITLLIDSTGGELIDAFQLYADGEPDAPGYEGKGHHRLFVGAP